MVLTYRGPRSADPARERSSMPGGEAQSALGPKSSDGVRGSSRRARETVAQPGENIEVAAAAADDPTGGSGVSDWERDLLEYSMAAVDLQRTAARAMRATLQAPGPASPRGSVAEVAPRSPNVTSLVGARLAHPSHPSPPATRVIPPKVARLAADMRKRGSWDNEAGELGRIAAANLLGRQIVMESPRGPEHRVVTHEDLHGQPIPEEAPLRLLRHDIHYDVMLDIPPSSESLYLAIARHFRGEIAPAEAASEIGEVKRALQGWFERLRPKLAAFAELYGDHIQAEGRPALADRVRGSARIEEVEELVPVIAANMLGSAVTVLFEGAPDRFYTLDEGLRGEQLNVRPEKELCLFVRADGRYEPVRRVPGDGDCFFHGLLTALGSQSTPYGVQTLRNQFADWIEVNAEAIAPYVAEVTLSSRAPAEPASRAPAEPASRAPAEPTSASAHR